MSTFTKNQLFVGSCEASLLIPMWTRVGFLGETSSYTPDQPHPIPSKAYLVPEPTKLIAATFYFALILIMPIVGLVVEATVSEGRLDEFLTLIEADAVASRKEPGCLRFDVVQAQDDPNKFFFYELYTDEDAVAYHNEQQYLKDVVAFVTGGGAKIVIKKATGKFMTE